MKAIMLCCDKYHMFAYHTILSYQKHWPTNNFVFHIPWTYKIPTYIENDNRISKNKIKFIQCVNSSFKTTVSTLLENINDNEWIYWCSSDQYLTQINDEIANNVEKLLDTDDIFKDNNIFGLSSALLVKNGAKLIKKKSEDISSGSGWKIVEKEPWDSSRTITLWFHQYLRAKVIKHIFNAFDEPNVAKNLDKQLYSNIDKIYCFPKLGRYFTINCKIAKFAENTSRGKILLNTLKSFKEYNLDVPTDFDVMEKEIHWL